MAQKRFGIRKLGKQGLFTSVEVPSSLWKSKDIFPKHSLFESLSLLCLCFLSITTGSSDTKIICRVQHFECDMATSKGQILERSTLIWKLKLRKKRHWLAPRLKKMKYCVQIIAHKTWRVQWPLFLSLQSLLLLPFLLPSLCPVQTGAGGVGECDPKHFTWGRELAILRSRLVKLTYCEIKSE